MRAYINEWNNPNTCIEIPVGTDGTNFGHNNVFTVESSERQGNDKTFLKMLNFKHLIESMNLQHQFSYVPFERHTDNEKYAVISLFIDTNNVLTLTKDPRRGLTTATFFSKYVTSIIVYMIITFMERNDFRFRMYFDFYTMHFLNQYTIGSMFVDVDNFVDTLFSNTGCFVNNLNDLKTAYLARFMQDVNNELKTILKPDFKLGDAVFIVFMLGYCCTDYTRASRFEVFLYNFYECSNDAVVMQTVLVDNVNTTIFVHSDYGFIGSVVRAFAFRQQRFTYNEQSVYAPALVIIRDAHRCPSSDVDTLITTRDKKYDWVHNLYYWAPWHARESDSNVIYKGPIFFYINARRTAGELCIMGDDEWTNTFGRIFKMDGNKVWTPMKDYLQRININLNMNRNEKDKDMYKLGVGYGIDEYLSTFCVYNEKGVPFTHTSTEYTYLRTITDNSRWLHMYYNWEVLDVFDQSMCKEAYAMNLSVALLLMIYGQASVPYITAHNMMTSNSPILSSKLLRRLSEYIPPKENIHSLVGYSHEGRTNLTLSVYTLKFLSVYVNFINTKYVIANQNDDTFINNYVIPFIMFDSYNNNKTKFKCDNNTAEIGKGFHLQHKDIDTILTYTDLTTNNKYTDWESICQINMQGGRKTKRGGKYYTIASNNARIIGKLKGLNTKKHMTDDEDEEVNKIIAEILLTSWVSEVDADFLQEDFLLNVKTYLLKDILNVLRRKSPPGNSPQSLSDEPIFYNEAAAAMSKMNVMTAFKKHFNNSGLDNMHSTELDYISYVLHTFGRDSWMVYDSMGKIGDVKFKMYKSVVTPNLIIKRICDIVSKKYMSTTPQLLLHVDKSLWGEVSKELDGKKKMGGRGRKSKVYSHVLYDGVIRKVHVDKSTSKKYIMYKHNTIFLGNIKGKYRWVDPNDASVAKVR